MFREIYRIEFKPRGITFSSRYGLMSPLSSPRQHTAVPHSNKMAGSAVVPARNRPPPFRPSNRDTSTLHQQAGDSLRFFLLASFFLFHSVSHHKISSPVCFSVSCNPANMYPAHSVCPAGLAAEQCVMPRATPVTEPTAGKLEDRRCASEG